MTDAPQAHVLERENQWRGVHVAAVLQGLLHRLLECVATENLLDWLVGLRPKGSCVEAARLLDEREAERDADAEALGAQLTDY